MESFQWNTHFETGIPRVDKQHQRLVAIINNFGSLIIQNRLAIEDIQSVLEEKQKEHSATGPLLAALRLLFQQVSNRNRDLVKLNHSLEAKVAARTMDLFEANMTLEKLSLTDSLTGLPNRRHAMESLKHLWKESNDTNTDLSCMMVDADRFKQVNDTHGHAAGDQVLIKLSQQLQHSVRNDDIVCRMGGDEFFILCPNTPENGALHLAELIRKAVDKGVYAAKASGRNCVKSSEEIHEN